MLFFLVLIVAQFMSADYGPRMYEPNLGDPVGRVHKVGLTETELQQAHPISVLPKHRKVTWLHAKEHRDERKGRNHQAPCGCWIK